MFQSIAHKIKTGLKKNTRLKYEKKNKNFPENPRLYFY